MASLFSSCFGACQGGSLVPPDHIELSRTEVREDTAPPHPQRPRRCSDSVQQALRPQCTPRMQLKALYEKSIALNNGKLIVHGEFWCCTHTREALRVLQCAHPD